MPDKPKIATKYDNDDPEFTGPSTSSDQTTRNLPQRAAKTNKPIVIISTSSSDEENFQSPLKSNSSNPQSTQLDSLNERVEVKSVSVNETIQPKSLKTISQIIVGKQKVKVMATQPQPQPLYNQEQLENILMRVMTARIGTTPQPSASPKFNLEILNMSNYSFWSKAMRAALKMMNLWVDPSKSPTNLDENEKVINEKAAQFILTNIDRNNMALITSENEQCFITIWKLLKEFHAPQTAATLIDFYSAIHNLIHRSGEDVRFHLLKLDREFERVLETTDKLSESHKVAIVLASVKQSAEFRHLFQSASWLKREDLSLKVVTEAIISAQDSEKGFTPQNAHAAKQFKKKNHRRRPRDPQNGWACPRCQMDNHRESECFKRNRQTSQGQTFTNRSNTAQNDEQVEGETSNVARAFHGSFTSSKRTRSPEVLRSSTAIRSRLGNKIEDPDVLEIDFSGHLSDFGKKRQSQINMKFHSSHFQKNKKIQRNKSQSSICSEYEICSESEIKSNLKSKNIILSLNSLYSENLCNKMKSNTKTNWIIDSGATIHMCYTKEILTNYRSRGGQFVTISDGSKIPIEGFGTLRFFIIGDDNLKHQIILENVAFVPKLAVNLISVKELTNLNVLVSFTDSKCKIIHKRGSITIGSLLNSSYIMTITHKININSNLCIHDWHRKLSHKNISHIKMVQDVLQLKVQKCKCSDECINCIKGKICAPPFPKSSEKPKFPRNLITSDLCGPFRVSSLGGAKYFLTFIDAATDYTEVVTIKNKSDAAIAIKNYMEKCKTQFGEYPKAYRTDRAGEFVASEVQTFLMEKGIKFECTVPNTPQQNGISERKNRTLVEAVRTILLSKDLPHHLWGEALNYANETFNSIPKKNEKLSPREKFFNKKFQFQFIEFGTQVIFHSNKPERSKLAPKGIQGTFVGNDMNSKGYRIYCDGKILIKRIVKFLSNKSEEPQICQNFSPQTQTEEDKLSPRRSERIAAKQSLATQSQQFEPKTFKQAMKCPEKELWVKAMEQELDSIHNHQTWTEVDLPKDRVAIGSKWVYKIKTDADGQNVYKARLVAQGFTQKYGEDFDEVFAPVARPTSFRILLTVAGKENMSIVQFDVKTAFLNGVLEQEIYMKTPQGFENSEKVLKLNKSLYGLKQAARVWNQAIHDCLLNLKFLQSSSDSCLYINESYKVPCYLIIHVDDMLMASKDIKIIDELSRKISMIFELKCLGEVKQFIGINVRRQTNGIYSINQSAYITKIAETFQLQDTKGSQYPLDPGYFKLEEENLLDSNKEYRKIIGMLLYVSTNTRPDIAAAVGILSQRIEKPRKIDLNECFRVLKYLIKTKNHSIILGSHNSPSQLLAYTDANWAENKLTRKSTSGFLCQLFASPVSWSSKRQDVIAISTTESEFYALAETVREIKWLRSLLADFKIVAQKPITIFIDSQSCIKMIENEKFSNRTKHIDVRYKFAKDEITKGNIKLVYVPTETNIADMLTKPLAGTKIKSLRNLSNIKDPDMNDTDN